MQEPIVSYQSLNILEMFILSILFIKSADMNNILLSFCEQLLEASFGRYNDKKNGEKILNNWTTQQLILIPRVNKSAVV